MNFSTPTIADLVELFKGAQEHPLGAVLVIALVLASVALAYVVLWRP